jgi:hypothetical protein
MESMSVPDSTKSTTHKSSQATQEIQSPGNSALQKPVAQIVIILTQAQNEST